MEKEILEKINELNLRILKLQRLVEALVELMRGE